MIETERLIIRPYQIEDAESFFANLCANKSHLEDYFFNMLKTNKSVKDVEKYFIKKQKDWKTKKGYACGIFLKDKNILIGHISIREIDWKIPKGELAYFIFKSHTGQKFSYEALKAYSNWCMIDQKFKRLFLKISTDNFSSIKTAENCNFKFEGLLRKDYRKKEDTLIDMNIYGFVNED